MKKFLMNLIAKKQNTIKELRAKMDASEDINEVRSLGAQIAAAQEEIEEARAKLAECNTNLGNARAELGEDEDNQEDGEEDDEENDEEKEEVDKYLVDNNQIVVVTYGDRDDKTFEKTAYKSFILNYNNFAVKVTYKDKSYTIPSGGYVVLYD